MTNTARRVAADTLVVGGGSALLLSAFVHWVSSGDGSGLRGHALIDAVIAVGRHVPGMSTTRLTVLWYLVPALGAGSLIAAGSRGAGSGAARVVALASVLAVAASVGTFGWLVGFSRLGRGAWLSVAGAVAVAAGSWLVAQGRAPSAHRSEWPAGAGSSVVRAGDS